MTTATAADQAPLPLFYKELSVLNSREHGTWRSRTTDKASWLTSQNIVPLTVEEFTQAQRYYPIIFSAGHDPVPLALMGLNEGVNVFVDDEGKLQAPVYIPAYARRYPFMLARLSPETTDLSLCFDPTANLVGDFSDGAMLFEGEAPSETCRETLQFCEQFEMAGKRTADFMAELTKHDLLMDGELAIREEGYDQPFLYHGFQMINETKLQELPGKVLQSWNQNGMLMLVAAHRMSLDLMRDIFDRQHSRASATAMKNIS